MGVTLLGAGSTALSTAQGVNTTQYITVGAGGITFTATETALDQEWGTAGTLSKLCVNVVANSLTTATTTLKSRINNADGNQSVSVGAGLTGIFVDSSNTDSLSVGDDVAISSVVPNSGAGTIQYGVLTCNFSADANTVTKIATFGPGDSNSFNNSTRYSCYAGAVFWTSLTSTASEMKVDIAGTATRLLVCTTVNNRTTDTTVRNRVNDADGNLVVTIGAGLTGWFEDTTNSDTLAAGDSLGPSVTTGASAESLALVYIGVTLTNSSDSKMNIFTGRANGIARTASATASYVPIVGSYASNQTTESNVTMQTNFACTASKLRIRISASTTTGDATVRLRKNASDGNQSITIGAGLTGYFEDASNTDSIAATDDLAYSIVDGTSGSFTVRSMSLLLNSATTSSARVYAFISG